MPTNLVYYSRPAPLLDKYPGAAAAYSLRKLRGSYSGSAIRVRRASDNAEQDIGFTANNLDTPALISFCSGTNGFVTTWYDQSGNARNATQTTAASQPKIYDSSTGVILENSRPSIDFNGTNNVLIQADGDILLTSTSYAYLFAATKSDITTVGNRWVYNNLTSVGNTRFGTLANIVANRYSTAARITDAAPSATLATLANNHNSNYYLITSYSAYANGSVGIYENGSNLVTALLPSSGTTPATSGLGGTIGAGSPTVQFFNGIITELIMYKSDQSANRTAIETNINNYYNIY